MLKAAGGGRCRRRRRPRAADHTTAPRSLGRGLHSAHSFHRHDRSGTEERAHAGDGVEHGVASVADREDCGRDGRGHRERQCSGDVEHTKVLGSAGFVGEDVDGEGKIMHPEVIVFAGSDHLSEDQQRPKLAHPRHNAPRHRRSLMLSTLQRKHRGAQLGQRVAPKTSDPRRRNRIAMRTGPDETLVSAPPGTVAVFVTARLPVVTNDQSSDARTLADHRAATIARAWYLTDRDQPVVQKSRWIDSLVVTCFPSEDAARVHALTRGADLEPVSEAWSFARRVASLGCSAIMLAEDDNEIILPLLAPAHDPLTPRPTHLELARTPTQVLALGLRGIRAHLGWELGAWNRYDLLDPTTATAQRANPLADWSSGEPLYELHWRGHPICVRTSQLLGPFAATDGVIVYCSSMAESRRMARRLRPGDYLALDTVSPRPPEFDIGCEFSAVEIRDVTSRLHELDEPSRMYAVNPASPRHGTGWGLAIAPETLHTVSGLWTWPPANELIHEEERHSWASYDTCHYDGGVRESLRGVRSSFRPDLPLGNDEDLAPADYEDAVAARLATAWRESWDRTLRSSEPETLDDFMLAGWNLPTGEPSLFYFRDVLEACQWLLAYEREIESGLHLRWIPGPDEAGRDEGRDDASGASPLRRRLERFCIDLATRGYVPQDASRLIGIANRSLRTLHLHYGGYFKDTAYDCCDIPSDLAWISSGFDFPAVLEWLASAEQPASVPPHRTPVLADIWQDVTPRSRGFLAGAAGLREDYNGVPNWDAAPLVLQICKAVEVQLHDVVQRLVSVLDTGMAAPDQPSDLKLLEFANRTGRLELGSIGSLLRGSNAGPLTQAFRDALVEAGGSSIVSRSFGRALTDLRNNFRNPAAHDTRFSYSQAEYLWSRWLTDADGPARYRTLTAPRLPEVDEARAGMKDNSEIDFMKVLVGLRFIARRRELTETLYSRLSQTLWTSSTAWKVEVIAHEVALALEEHRLDIPSFRPALKEELRPNRELRRGITFLASSHETVFAVRLITAIKDQLQRCTREPYEFPYQATLWTLLTLLSGPNGPSSRLMQEVITDLSVYRALPPRGPFVARLSKGP